jgi:hypothetical protein
MKINKATSILTAVILGLSAMSCNNDETLLYNNTTLGNYVDGTYTSDQGNIFNIVSQECKDKIDTMYRALTICDVLKKTEGGKENEYDVHMTFMMEILVKDIIALGTELEDDVKVEDPINIERLWISGGYINMIISFPFKDASVKHMVNLVQQESGEAGTYSFRLTHNAFEDAIKDGEVAGYEVSGGYISFPINSLMKEEEATLKISWNGFSVTNLEQTKECKVEGVYKKDGFEHAPLTTPKSKASIR